MSPIGFHTQPFETKRDLIPISKQSEVMQNHETFFTEMNLLKKETIKNIVKWYLNSTFENDELIHVTDNKP